MELALGTTSEATLSEPYGSQRGGRARQAASPEELGGFWNFDLTRPHRARISTRTGDPNLQGCGGPGLLGRHRPTSLVAANFNFPRRPSYGIADSRRIPFSAGPIRAEMQNDPASGLATPTSCKSLASLQCQICGRPPNRTRKPTLHLRVGRECPRRGVARNWHIATDVANVA